MKFFRLTPVNLDFIDEIYRIEKASFSRPWTKDNISFEIHNFHSLPFLLLNDHEIVGYLFATNSFEEIQINKICIRLEYRGNGFGELLLDRFLCEVFTKEIMMIHLEVNINNIPAIKLYQKKGFTINRIRDKIFDDCDDGAEMVLMHH